MSSTVTKALRGLYKKMTNNEAAGNSTVKVLNEIATAMGASTTHTSVTQCIDEIAANYSASGSSDFSTAEVTFITNQSGYSAQIFGAIVDISSQVDYPTSITAIETADAEIENGDVYTVALYNGHTYVGTQADNITVSGNATAEEYIPEGTIWLITITGDCTITIS